MTKWFVTASLLCGCLLPVGLRADEASAQLARELYSRAATALLAQNVPVAASELAKLVEQCPDDELAPLAALRLAECHLAQADSAAAIDVLEAWKPKLAGSARAQALEPTALLRGELILARAYFMAGQLPAVIKLAREQTDIYGSLEAPSAAEKKLLAQIGALSLQASKRREQAHAKRLRDAAEQVRNKQYAQGLQSLDACPSDELGADWLWRYRLLLAQCLLGTSDAAAALKELDQIALEPLAAAERTAVRMARLDAAMALQQTERAQAEVDALATLVDGDERLGPTVALRAVEIATLRKDRPAARRLAQAAKEKYPQFAAGHEFDLLLARNALASIQFDEARRILTALIEAPPRHDPSAAPRAQWLLGESYFLSQDYRRAIAAYSAAIDSNAAPAWTEVALMQRGKCYELLGEFDSATADYLRVVQDFQRSSLAASARTRLSAIDNYVRSANASTLPAQNLK